MTAETQRYRHQQYPLHLSKMQCFSNQESYTGHSGVRPSTLLKLSEHIRSKRYSLNLLREAAKDNRTKRKTAPYASAFRPSIPSTSPPLRSPHSTPLITSSCSPPTSGTLYNPLPIKPVPDQKKVYYVSGLELLSWVSSKVDRLEVPNHSLVDHRGSILKEVKAEGR